MYVGHHKSIVKNVPLKLHYAYYVTSCRFVLKRFYIFIEILK